MPVAAACRLCAASSGNFPMISDDLVNSYHLLLCALDLVLTNALLCNARKELLNPDFRGSRRTQQPSTEIQDTAASDWGGGHFGPNVVLDRLQYLDWPLTRKKCAPSYFN